MLAYKSQLFPVFHPISLEPIGMKLREQVHCDGDWHVGIQAHILKKNKAGSFDILLQKRSKSVDIGQSKLDQSVAIQLIKEDNLSLENALARGLKEELGLTEYYSILVPLPEFAIIKKYKEARNILNCEFVYLYLVIPLSDWKPVVSCGKVESFFWDEWNHLKGVMNGVDKNLFTKTAQSYFSDQGIVNRIESYSKGILALESVFKSGSSTYDDNRVFFCDYREENPIFYHFSQEDKLKYNYLFELK